MLAPWTSSAVRSWKSFLTSLGFHCLIDRMGLIQSFHRVTLRIHRESVCPMPGTESMTINADPSDDGHRTGAALKLPQAIRRMSQRPLMLTPTCAPSLASSHVPLQCVPHQRPGYPGGSPAVLTDAFLSPPQEALAQGRPVSLGNASAPLAYHQLAPRCRLHQLAQPSPFTPLAQLRSSPI